MDERRRAEVRSEVAVLIAAAAVAAAVCLLLTWGSTLDALSDEPQTFLAFVALAFLLQLFSVEVYGGGRIGVTGIAMLACGFALGVGPAVTIASLSAVVQFIRARGLLHRAVFDVSQWTMATAAGVLAYEAVTRVGGTAALVAPLASVFGGLAFVTINNLLLCAAIGLSDSQRIRIVWQERFRWARFHYLAFGPLAFAGASAYDAIGIAGLFAFALPPGLVLVSVRQYVEKTRAAAEDVRRANQELERTIRDVNDLYEFSRGLAEQPHERATIVSYAEQTLERLVGAHSTIVEHAIGVDELRAGDAAVGAVLFSASDRFDAERWGRLREAILPQLATALDNAGLAARVRKTHLDTIAALSKSMEAKDYYTGGHTERVAELAVALGERLGFSGPDLDALQVGALLHDIGKIGIPESILRKPSPLDDEEWAVMKEHPVISDYILSGVDLPRIVRQIARSSHERIDGAGYPDGLGGDDIPLVARIVLVADAFDALTTDRPYRAGRQPHEGLEEIREHAGTQFCPLVVAALEQVFAEQPELVGGVRLRVVA